MTPYENYKSHALWKVIEKAIAELVGNQDMLEKTKRDYIVGYLVEKIVESQVRPER